MDTRRYARAFVAQLEARIDGFDLGYLDDCFPVLAQDEFGKRIAAIVEVRGGFAQVAIEIAAKDEIENLRSFLLGERLQYLAAVFPDSDHFGGVDSTAIEEVDLLVQGLSDDGAVFGQLAQLIGEVVFVSPRHDGSVNEAFLVFLGRGRSANACRIGRFHLGAEDDRHGGRDISGIYEWTIYHTTR